MEDIQCAIVGYGGIAAFHADAIEQVEGARIKTVVGRRLEPTEAFARKRRAESWTIDYSEMLKDDGIDAVIINFHQMVTEDFWLHLGNCNWAVTP